MLDARLQWGDVWGGVKISANTYKLWESDARMSMSFTLATDNNKSLLTVFISQAMNRLADLMVDGLKELQEWAAKIIDDIKADIEVAKDKVRKANEEVQRAIEPYQEDLRRMQRKLESADDVADHWVCRCGNNDRCGGWTLGACAKAGTYKVGVKTAQAAVWAAEKALEGVRAGVQKLSDTAVAALGKVQELLEGAKNGLIKLTQIITNIIDDVRNAINEGLSYVDKFIKVEKFQIQSNIGGDEEEDSKKPALALNIRYELFEQGMKDLDFNVPSLKPKEIAYEILVNLGDSIYKYLVNQLPESVRTALNIRARKRRMRKRRQFIDGSNERFTQAYDATLCSNSTYVRECIPFCCYKDNEDPIEDSIDLFDALDEADPETSERNTTMEMLSVFHYGRAILYKTGNSITPIKISDSGILNPTTIVLAYEPGALDESAGYELQAAVQPIVDRTMAYRAGSLDNDADITADRPRVTLACEKCGGSPSNGLWRLYVGPVAYYHAPALVDDLTSSIAEREIRYDMMGRGAQSPTLVEISAGSFKSMESRISSRSNLLDTVAGSSMVQVSNFSEYERDTCVKEVSVDGSETGQSEEDKSGGTSALGGAEIAGIVLGILAAIALLAGILAAMAWMKKKHGVNSSGKGNTPSSLPTLASFTFDGRGGSSREVVVEKSPSTVSSFSLRNLGREPSFRGDSVTISARRWNDKLGDARLQGVVVEDAPANASEVKVYIPGDDHTGTMGTVEIVDVVRDDLQKVSDEYERAFQ